MKLDPAFRPRRRASKLPWGFCLGLLMLLQSCARSPADPLRVGTNVWPGYEGLYLASNLGYFENTSIRLVEYPSSSEVIRALQNGAIEAAALTADEALLLAENNQEPRIVLVMDFSNGADVIIAQGEFKSMADLRGRRIGAELNALGSVMLARSLEKSGMLASEITVVPISLHDHERAFLAREVDAIVTFEPRRSRLLARGGNQVFDSSQIRNEIVDVLVVKRPLLERNPPALELLVRSWFQAHVYLKKNPDDAFSRLAQHEGVSKEEFAAAWRLIEVPELEANLRLLGGNNRGLRESLRRLSAVMVKNRLLKRDVDIESMMDDRLVSRITQ